MQVSEMVVFCFLVRLFVYVFFGVCVCVWFFFGGGGGCVFMVTYG